MAIKKPLNYTDYEDRYAKGKGLVLEFFHVPSGKIVKFKALITQFSDKYESGWNSEDVYGRMDPIQTFQGTKRIISLGWDVVAASLEEAKENLQKVTLLLAMLYPTYDGVGGGASTISAAPIFKLSFVNLIKDYGITAKTTDSTTPTAVNVSQQQSRPDLFTENTGNEQSILPPPSRPVGAGCVGQSRHAGLVGSIGGFTYEPDFEQGVFDPPNERKLYPQTINLSCEYTVLHTHQLGWSRGKEFRNPNFPYGEAIREQETKGDKSVSEARTKRTSRQKRAGEKKILGS